MRDGLWVLGLYACHLANKKSVQQEGFRGSRDWRGKISNFKTSCAFGVLSVY